MESDDFETAENDDEPGPGNGLATPLTTSDRARRMRRLALQVDSHSSLLDATWRLRRQLPGDEQLGDPLSTAGALPVEVIGRTGPACGWACTGVPRASSAVTTWASTPTSPRAWGTPPNPGQVLVSDALLARIDPSGLHTGRAKRLRADGAPRDLHVVCVSRD